MILWIQFWQSVGFYNKKWFKAYNKKASLILNKKNIKYEMDSYSSDFNINENTWESLKITLN